jgi:hypothetical protein
MEASKWHRDTCILAISYKDSYPLSMNKNDTRFTLIHFDVWGPSSISITFSVRWLMTFIDDCAYMTRLYLLKLKDEVFKFFQSFHAMIQTQFSAWIQILYSNNS